MAKRPSVVQAAQAGDHLELLIALRERLSEEIESIDVKPRDLAALSRQIRDINKEIQSLEKPKGDFLDEAEQQPIASRDDAGAAAF